MHNFKKVLMFTINVMLIISGGDTTRPLSMYLDCSPIIYMTLITVKNVIFHAQKHSNKNEC